MTPETWNQRFEKEIGGGLEFNRPYKSQIKLFIQREIKTAIRAERSRIQKLLWCTFEEDGSISPKGVAWFENELFIIRNWEEDYSEEMR